MIHQPFRFAGSRGLPVEGDLRLPDDGGEAPLLVFVNGFLLTRDWGFYPYVATRLAERGFAVVTYDVPSAGAVSPPEAATISDELAELRTVVDGIAAGKVPGADRCLRESFGLIGHSKGGAVALLHARADRRARAIVTLAAFSTFDRFREAEAARIERDGFLEVPQPGSGRMVRIGRSFLHDLRREAERTSIEAAVRSLRVPLAFIHGEEDHIVGVSESEALYHWADKDRSRLIVIEKTGHTFGAVHPFTETNRDLERLLGIFTSFFTEHLIAASRA